MNGVMGVAITPVSGAYVRPNRGIRAAAEPGNGCRYEIVAQRVDAPTAMGVLGSVDAGGWLIVSCNTGRAYLFQGHGPLSVSYVQHHLGIRSDNDAEYITRLIGEVTGRRMEGVLP